MKLTATTRLAFVAAVFVEVFNSLPDKTYDNERREKRRLFLVLHRETVAIETPRLLALFFRFLVHVAATNNYRV